MDDLDDFEHELSRLMRQPAEPTPFEPRHRDGIWAAVDTRRAVRRRRAVTGSVVAVMAVAVGVAVLPGTVAGKADPVKVPPATVGPSLPGTPPPTPLLPATPSETMSTSGGSSSKGSSSGASSTGLPDGADLTSSVAGTSSGTNERTSPGSPTTSNAVTTPYGGSSSS